MGLWGVAYSTTCGQRHLRLPKGVDWIMQVWRQTPQAGVSLLQVCIWTSGLLQSPFPHYHHLCLQAGSPSEPHGGWHDCQQTASRVVLEHQPLLRCPGMAPLATAPVTGWRQFHPTCRQFWQVPDSPFLVHCRWIPSENQHSLLVPRLLLAWLSGLLFQSHRIPPPPRR